MLSGSEASEATASENGETRCFAALSMTCLLPGKKSMPFRYALTNLFLNGRHSFGKRDDATLFLSAQFEFDAAVFERAPADNGAQGQADEIGVVEFDTCRFQSVIIEDFHSCGYQVGVELVGDLARLGFVEVEAEQGNRVGGDAEGPDDTLFVVMLLHEDAHEPTDADAVAAHLDGVFVALRIQIGHTQQVAVLRTKFEDMARFAAAHDM